MTSVPVQCESNSLSPLCALQLTAPTPDTEEPPGAEEGVEQQQQQQQQEVVVATAKYHQQLHGSMLQQQQQHAADPGAPAAVAANGGDGYAHVQSGASADGTGRSYTDQQQQGATAAAAAAAAASAAGTAQELAPAAALQATGMPSSSSAGANWQRVPDARQATASGPAAHEPTEVHVAIAGV